MPHLLQVQTFPYRPYRLKVALGLQLPPCLPLCVSRYDLRFLDGHKPKLVPLHLHVLYFVTQAQ